MLPMTLHGQNSVRKPTASVVGEVYTIFDYRLHGTLMGSFIQIKRDYEVILYADGDTLRMKAADSIFQEFPPARQRFTSNHSTRKRNTPFPGYSN